VRTERTTRAPVVNSWTASDVRAILIQYGWLADAVSSISAAETNSSPAESWIENAATWLGPHAANRGALAELLGLVFRYDAREIIASPEAHAVMLREGARDAIRALGLEVLVGPPVDSARFNEIFSAVRQRSGTSGRVLFYSIRLALAGRVGEGELDRVILLLATAAATPGFASAKTARERMIEFCAALD
jgi:hypothetical protein